MGATAMSFSSGLLAAVSNNDQTRRLALLNNACRDVTIRADSSILEQSMRAIAPVAGS